MRTQYTLIFTLAGVLAGCSTGLENSSAPDMTTNTLADYQRAAEKFNSVISLPVFEMTTNDIALSVKAAIAAGNNALDQIGKLDPAQVNFTNTVRALDDATYQASLTENRLEIIRQTSTDAALRDAAEEQNEDFGPMARQPGLPPGCLTSAIQAYAGTHPNLAGEDAKLLQETLRDYRRAGLALPKEQRDEVESLRKKLSDLETDFGANIRQGGAETPFHQGGTGRRAGGFSEPERCQE